MTKIRPILTVLLSAFVLATVGTILFGDPSGAADGAAGDATSDATSDRAAPTAAASDDGGAETEDAVDESAPPRRRFVAWYLHGSMRCRTCRAIEDISHEAIDTAFAADIRDGRLAWRTANFEEAAVEPLAKRFGVSGSSLVIAELRGDEVLRHEVLAKTWDLVDDRRGLMDYVVMAVDAFMAGAPEGGEAGTPAEEAAR